MKIIKCIYTTVKLIDRISHTICTASQQQQIQKSRKGIGAAVVCFLMMLLMTRPGDSQSVEPSDVSTSPVGTIDGRFRVDSNGAANYTISIKAPPGTAGMEPKLSLVYESQGKNGIVGMGWNLSGLSMIERCPATMAIDGFVGGVNYDNNDRFCLDGERLININDGAYYTPGTEAVYHTEKGIFQNRRKDIERSADISVEKG